MKKKMLIMLMCLVMMVTLTACINSNGADLSKEDNVVVQVKNNSNVKIYGVELKWYMNGTLAGHEGGANADGSAIGKGESLRGCEITKGAISEGTNLLFEVTLVTNKEMNERFTLESTVSLDLSYGTIYNFEISGDTLDDAVVELTGTKNASKASN